ncbi:MAG: hypothetical protein CL610_29590 [Anaerolineaceae bacterium]|nr:hypothetical protein [Anaerolineaceae bacterium]
MRLYYLIRDQSAVKQTPTQRADHQERWQEQPFTTVTQRADLPPNQRLQLVKFNPSGEYGLGGIDLLDDGIRQHLNAESAKIDARFKQLNRQLELVLLKELRASLSPDDSARANQLSVEVIAFGERDTAISDVQDYLRAHAGTWYPSKDVGQAG